MSGTAMSTAALIIFFFIYSLVALMHMDGKIQGNVDMLKVRVQSRADKKRIRQEIHLDPSHFQLKYPSLQSHEQITK